MAKGRSGGRRGGGGEGLNPSDILGTNSFVFGKIYFITSCRFS